MNQKTLQPFLYAISLASLFWACSEKEKYAGPSPEEVNALYSNKLSVAKEANLALTYSGRECIGKEIYFDTPDGKTATLTLLGVLPGEKETPVENVTLAAKPDGYDFSGNAVGIHGTFFQYKGSVESGSMAIALSDIQVASNILTTTGTWNLVQPASSQQIPATQEGEKPYIFYHSGFRLLTDHTELFSVRGLLSTVLNNMLSSVLRNVTFGSDGNITAQYAPLPEGTSLTNILFSPLVRPDEAWVSSPINLASYYVKEGALYVIPNVDMIVRLIQTNQTKNRAAEASGIDWEVLKSLYAQLNKWTTTGIRLQIQTDLDTVVLVQGNWEKYEGSVCLYLDKTEIAPLLPLLPLVKELIPEDVMNGSAGSILNSLIDPVINGFIQADRIELGLLFNN